MKILNNFLTSGHEFTDDDNLQKFRFSLLNSLLVIAIFFTSLNLVAAMLEFIVFSPIYEKALAIYTLTSLFTLYLLRKDKIYYPLIVNFAIFSSLALFFFALVTAVEDEFRLIWFFLALFVSFILMGKKYGLLIMLFILSGIFFIHQVYGLEFTRLAFFTFFNSFLIFTAFSYFFLNKIENDAFEFAHLNNKLKDKVTKEVQQREEQEQMLLQQCRLASMGEMIDSIAHQWRQPLMNINAILMNMDRIIELKEKPKEHLEVKMDEVINLTTHMSQTIEDFRSLFKENKEKHSFSVKEAVEHSLGLLENPLKEVTVTFNAIQKSTFHGHKNELIQVLLTLITNAIEALSNSETQQKSIFIDINSNLTNLTITIEDNAGGINMEHLDVVFDPYFTTKDRTGGTGLGLYVAKIIIEQNMKGTLNVINTDKGAKFTITLGREDVIHT